MSDRTLRTTGPSLDGVLSVCAIEAVRGQRGGFRSEATAAPPATGFRLAQDTIVR